MPTKTLSRMLFAVAAALATFSCAAPGTLGAGDGPAVAIDERAAGSTIPLRVGQTLTVALPGNPTTGFTWQVAPGAEHLLSRQGEPEFKASSRAIGAGGIVTFTFKAVGEGEGKLQFIYTRTFQPDAPGSKRFEVSVVVSR